MLHEDHAYLIYSLYTWHLEQFLESSNCVINSCWVNKHFLYLFSGIPHSFGSSATSLTVPSYSSYFVSLIAKVQNPVGLSCLLLLYLHSVPSHFFWSHGLKYSLSINDSQIYMAHPRLYLYKYLLISSWEAY